MEIRRDLKRRIIAQQTMLRSELLTVTQRSQMMTNIDMLRNELDKVEAEINFEEIASRRRFLAKNKGLFDIFNTLWVTLMAYTSNQGFLSKEGYIKFHRAMQISLIGFKGFETIPDSTIEADYMHDKRLYGPISKDAFFDMLFETIETWTEIVDPSYYAAFAWTMLDCIADISFHPPRLRPFREMKCFTEVENEASMMKSYMETKQIRGALSIRSDLMMRVPEVQKRLHSRKMAVSFNDFQVSMVEILSRKVLAETAAAKALGGGASIDESSGSNETRGSTCTPHLNGSLTFPDGTAVGEDVFPVTASSGAESPFHQYMRQLNRSEDAADEDRMDVVWDDSCFDDTLPQPTAALHNDSLTSSGADDLDAAGTSMALSNSLLLEGSQITAVSSMPSSSLSFLSMMQTNRDTRMELNGSYSISTAGGTTSSHGGTVGRSVAHIQPLVIDNGRVDAGIEYDDDSLSTNAYSDDLNHPQDQQQLGSGGPITLLSVNLADINMLFAEFVASGQKLITSRNTTATSTTPFGRNSSRIATSSSLFSPSVYADKSNSDFFLSPSFHPKSSDTVIKKKKNDNKNIIHSTLRNSNNSSSMITRNNEISHSSNDYPHNSNIPTTVNYSTNNKIVSKRSKQQVVMPQRGKLYRVRGKAMPTIIAAATSAAIINSIAEEQAEDDETQEKIVSGSGGDDKTAGAAGVTKIIHGKNISISNNNYTAKNSNSSKVVNGTVDSDTPLSAFAAACRHHQLQRRQQGTSSSSSSLQQGLLGKSLTTATAQQPNNAAATSASSSSALLKDDNHQIHNYQNMHRYYSNNNSSMTNSGYLLEPDPNWMAVTDNYTYIYEQKKLVKINDNDEDEESDCKNTDNEICEKIADNQETIDDNSEDDDDDEDSYYDEVTTTVAIPGGVVTAATILANGNRNNMIDNNNTSSSTAAVAAGTTNEVRGALSLLDLEVGGIGGTKLILPPPTSMLFTAPLTTCGSTVVNTGRKDFLAVDGIQSSPVRQAHYAVATVAAVTAQMSRQQQPQPQGDQQQQQLLLDGLDNHYNHSSNSRSSSPNVMHRNSQSPPAPISTRKSFIAGGMVNNTSRSTAAIQPPVTTTTTASPPHSANTVSPRRRSTYRKNGDNENDYNNISNKDDHHHHRHHTQPSSAHGKSITTSTVLPTTATMINDGNDSVVTVQDESEDGEVFAATAQTTTTTAKTIVVEEDQLANHEFATVMNDAVITTELIANGGFSDKQDSVTLPLQQETKVIFEDEDVDGSAAAVVVAVPVATTTTLSTDAAATTTIPAIIVGELVTQSRPSTAANNSMIDSNSNDKILSASENVASSIVADATTTKTSLFATLPNLDEAGHFLFPEEEAAALQHNDSSGDAAPLYYLYRRPRSHVPIASSVIASTSSAFPASIIAPPYANTITNNNTNNSAVYDPLSSIASSSASSSSPYPYLQALLPNLSLPATIALPAQTVRLRPHVVVANTTRVDGGGGGGGKRRQNYTSNQKHYDFNFDKGNNMFNATDIDGYFNNSNSINSMLLGRDGYGIYTGDLLSLSGSEVSESLANMQSVYEEYSKRISGTDDASKNELGSNKMMNGSNHSGSSNSNTNSTLYTNKALKESIVTANNGTTTAGAAAVNNYDDNDVVLNNNNEMLLQMAFDDNSTVLSSSLAEDDEFLSSPSPNQQQQQQQHQRYMQDQSYKQPQLKNNNNSSYNHPYHQQQNQSSSTNISGGNINKNYLTPPAAAGSAVVVPSELSSLNQPSMSSSTNNTTIASGSSSGGNNNKLMRGKSMGVDFSQLGPLVLGAANTPTAAAAAAGGGGSSARAISAENRKKKRRSKMGSTSSNNGTPVHSFSQAVDGNGDYTDAYYNTMIHSSAAAMSIAAASGAVDVAAAGVLGTTLPTNKLLLLQPAMNAAWEADRESVGVKLRLAQLHNTDHGGRLSHHTQSSNIFGGCTASPALGYSALLSTAPVTLSSKKIPPGQPTLHSSSSSSSNPVDSMNKLNLNDIQQQSYDSLSPTAAASRPISPLRISANLGSINSSRVAAILAASKIIAPAENNLDNNTTVASSVAGGAATVRILKDIGRSASDIDVDSLPPPNSSIASNNSSNNINSRLQLNNINNSQTNIGAGGIITLPSVVSATGRSLLQGSSLFVNSISSSIINDTSVDSLQYKEKEQLDIQGGGGSLPVTATNLKYNNLKGLHSSNNNSSSASLTSNNSNSASGTNKLIKDALRTANSNLPLQLQQQQILPTVTAPAGSFKGKQVCSSSKRKMVRLGMTDPSSSNSNAAPMYSDILDDDANNHNSSGNNLTSVNINNNIPPSNPTTLQLLAAASPYVITCLKTPSSSFSYTNNNNNIHSKRKPRISGNNNNIKGSKKAGKQQSVLNSSTATATLRNTFSLSALHDNEEEEEYTEQKQQQRDKVNSSSTMNMSSSMPMILPWLPKGATLQPLDHDRSNHVTGWREKNELLRRYPHDPSRQVMALKTQTAIKGAFELFAQQHYVQQQLLRDKMMQSNNL